MDATIRLAPGALGAKSHEPVARPVSNSIGAESLVWFTIGKGVLNEVFFPLIDTACVRDMGLIVSDGHDFFSSEKRDTTSEMKYVSDGVPAFHLTNTCKYGRYRIEKTILADPQRSVILQQIDFVPLKGSLADYKVFVLINPHLDNRGGGNSAWLGDYKGQQLLVAQRADISLALACSAQWLKRPQDSWGAPTAGKTLSGMGKCMGLRARRHGNVALTGEVDLAACKGRFVLALGFGRYEEEAGHRVLASLLLGFDAARRLYDTQHWSEWQGSLTRIKSPKKQTGTSLPNQRGGHADA